MMPAPAHGGASWFWMACPRPLLNAEAHDCQRDAERGLTTCQTCKAIWGDAELADLLEAQVAAYVDERPGLTDSDPIAQMGEVTALTLRLFKVLPAVLAIDLATCWARVRLTPGLASILVEEAIEQAAAAELRLRGVAS